MKAELSPKVLRMLSRLHNPDLKRILKALNKLEEEPPQGDIKTLSGEEGYRLRVGKYRILFNVMDDCIYVHDMGLRGQIYKRR